MHTEWSDGGNSIEEMARAAYKRGYRYIAITDHSRSLKIAWGLSIERLREQRQKIREVEKRLQEEWQDDSFRILAGVEMDILPDGRLDYPDEVLQELDLVIASVHTAFKQEEKVMMKRILAAIENNHVKLGYPFPFLLQNQRDIDPPFPWSTGFVSVFDNPTQILFGPMVASFAFYFILSFILLYLITGIRSKHRVR